MLKEWLARGVIVLGLAVVISIPAVNRLQPVQGVILHASLPEAGGWSPQDLTVAVGEPLHLQITSDDVTHGFAVGQLDQPAVEIAPGETTAITLVFTKPGKYTFYCTRWCSVDHWRMRGTIEVTGPKSSPAPVKPPLYVALGLDIDATHTASLTPSQMPSAWRGVMLDQKIPLEFLDRDYYLTHTPVDLWLALRSEPTASGLTDQQVWDLVAWVWQSNTTPSEVQAGRQLFIANCAACHGEAGAGDGVFAAELAAAMDQTSPDQALGEHTQRPADFTDAARMLSASPAHLQGKIIRGGMGTGMPSWGAIFTEDQTWALVAYLWTYQFHLEVNP